MSKKIVAALTALSLLGGAATALGLGQSPEVWILLLLGLYTAGLVLGVIAAATQRNE